jgi:hypothetical protein
VATVAATGDKRDDLVEPRRRPAPLQAWGVSGLSAGFFARGFLGDGLGSTGWVGRWGRAGVGSVGAQAGVEVADGRLQLGNAAFQRGDPFVTLQTSGTSHLGHDIIVEARQAHSQMAKPADRLRHLQRPENPNYRQCLAIASWAVGRNEEALHRIMEAEEQIRQLGSPSFSCWRYLMVSSQTFLEDCATIRRPIAGAQIRPPFFLAPTAPNLEHGSLEETV